MASTTGTLAATGSVTLTKPEADTLTQFVISGTYGTVTFVFEGTSDGTNYFPLAAVLQSTGAVVTGTIAPSDNATALYNVPSAGVGSVRLRVTAIASGTLAVTAQSQSYVGLPTLGNYLTGGTFGATTFNGQALFADSVKAAFGNDADITMAWDGTDFDVLQATVNSSIKLGVSGAGIDVVFYGDTAGANMTWDQSADALVFGAAANITFDATTGSKIGTATTQKIGFFNATPVVQPAANTDTTTGAAGSSTAVYLNTTFTGAGGTAAYTLGGVVTALKALGLLAP